MARAELYGSLTIEALECKPYFQREGSKRHFWNFLLTVRVVPLTEAALSVWIRRKQNKLLAVIRSVTGWFWIPSVPDVNLDSDGHE